MKIIVNKKNGVTILHLKGNLDADTVAQFKRQAYPLVEEGCHQMVIDCHTLDFIDSMGLGAMISLLRRVRTHAGDVKICALNKDVHSVFEITRLHRLFDIQPDWQTACERF
ncbi:MAG: STAS domain-containing protein [Deltaproteobacteria bacterium]|nr:STAS domain-containing protein [Deltaproteobacteria bacterium]